MKVYTDNMAMKFWITTDRIWWNRGVEIKPNRTALNSFKWEEITLQNFNISWKDELHIEVIVPNDKIATMIKIEDTAAIDKDTKFYFLAKTLNKTNINQKCIYQLDIWCTYLVASPNSYRNTKTLNVNEVNNYVNVPAIGELTGQFKYDWLNINYGQNKDFPLYLLNNWYVDHNNNHKDKLATYLNLNTQSNRNYVMNFSKYYVFKTKKTAYSDTSMYNYFLIPEVIYGNYYNEPTEKSWAWCTFYNRDRNKYIYATLCNSKDVLDRVIETYTKLPTGGLGEFLGIWYGPNYFRFKRNRYKFKLNADTYEADNTILLGSTDVPGLMGHPFLGHSKSQISPNQKFTINGHGEQSFEYTDQNHYALLGLLVDEEEIQSYFIDHKKDKYAESYTYLMNPNNSLYNGKFFFNQKFTLANEKDTTDINIQIPTSFDNYQNQIQSQRNTINTGLMANTTNFVKNTAQSLIGTVASAATGNVAGAIMGGVNLIGGTLQFFNQQAKYKAYLDDLRTKTSNTYTSYTDNFVYAYNYGSIFEIPKLSNNLYDIVGRERIAGYTTRPDNLVKFFGYDTTPYLINWVVFDDSEFYLKIDELTKLTLEVNLPNIYTPLIRQAIIEMLTNGVRVTKNPEQFIFLE